LTRRADDVEPVSDDNTRQFQDKTMTEQVMAAIDGSQFSEGVCDYAAWASLALAAPLTFLHVVDNHPQTAEPDLSGNIGLGAREHLLEELSHLDEQRAKVETAERALQEYSER